MKKFSISAVEKFTPGFKIIHLFVNLFINFFFVINSILGKMVNAMANRFFNFDTSQNCTAFSKIFFHILSVFVRAGEFNIVEN